MITRYFEKLMRTVKTVIPYKPVNPKSRMAAVFSEDERKLFVELSLENVLRALKEAGIKRIEIISTSALPLDDEKKIKDVFDGGDTEILISEDKRDLNTALNDFLKKADCPILIAMADLALIKKEDISAMISESPSSSQLSSSLSVSSSFSTDGEKKGIVRIAPGKDGGTNMLYIESPEFFEVNYYGESAEKHKKEAENKNFACEIYESFSAASDMDEPKDLENIRMRGEGKLRDFVCQILKE